MTRIASPGGSCFKTPAYRNRALLDLARLAPYCMACDAPNDGTVVAAHSNEGKGMAIKASDASIMFLCHTCHSAYDQGKVMERTERRAMAFEASAKTLRWLVERGHLIVAGSGRR